MPRQPPSAPVTARVLALLGIDAQGSRSVVGSNAAAARPDERSLWGWIPEPPDPVPEDHEAEQTSGTGEDVERRRRGRHRPSMAPTLITTPMSLRGARIHVSWHAVVALIFVVLVAALVFVVRVARAEQSAAPRPVTGSTPAGVVGRSVPSAFALTGASGGSGTATTGGTSAASGVRGGGAAGDGPAGGSGVGGSAAPGSASQAPMIVVHVVGQVTRPGVVAVVQGGRVVDAIALAGGALPGADVQHVNLARVLLDGEQVYVPKPGEAVPAVGGPVAAGGAAGGGRASPGGAASGRPIDLNTADVSALDGLPGVGPVLAQRIVDWRSEHGRFTTVDELGEVSGIGEKLLSQIRTRVRV